MLEIQGLVKKYGNFKALDNLNLSVERGSVFGFVGPNGAGKTTTMKIVSGLLSATEGSVIVDGKDYSRDPEKLKEKIGYMPDFFGVYDNLKVMEYMDFYCGAYYIPYKDRPKLIENLLEIVDLKEKKDFYVDSLSRGMKQRLCLARSLVHDPELLILDEPASGLDPRARVEMKEILKDLSAMGKTIIISSHILSELSEMCTDIGIFDKGKLLMQGTVNDILKKVSKKKIIKLEPLELDERIVPYLEENPYISGIIERNTNIEFYFSGDNNELSNILTGMIKKDIKLISFTEKEGSLEEIFMQITGGAEKND